MNDYSNVIKINAKSSQHDGNNNRTMAPAAATTAPTTPLPPNSDLKTSKSPVMPTTKVRKSYSINQIDLSLLKNELDEYIDRELRLTNFGKNTLAQRRFQYENGLKKVSNQNDSNLNHFQFFWVDSIQFLCKCNQ